MIAKLEMVPTALKDCKDSAQSLHVMEWGGLSSPSPLCLKAKFDTAVRHKSLCISWVCGMKWE